MRPKTLLTLEGCITFYRSMYLPANSQNAYRLSQGYKNKALYPLDKALGIDNLSFKISPLMMLEIAKKTATSQSYQNATDALSSNINMGIDTTRKVTNHIGKLIFNNDCKLATEAWAAYLSSDQPKSREIISADTLYIELAKFSFPTKGENNKSNDTHFCMFGSVFSSYYLTAPNDTSFKPEYICCVDNPEVFKKQLSLAACRSGLKNHKKYVLLIDGSDWSQSFIQYFNDVNVKIFLDPSITTKKNISNTKHKFNRKSHKRVYSESAGQHNILYDQNHFSQYDYHTARDITDHYKKSRKYNDYSFHNDLELSKLSPLYEPTGSGKKVKDAIRDRLLSPHSRWEASSAQYILAVLTKLYGHKWDDYVVPLVLQYYRKDPV